MQPLYHNQGYQVKFWAPEPGTGWGWGAAEAGSRQGRGAFIGFSAIPGAAMGRGDLQRGSGDSQGGAHTAPWRDAR